MEEAQYGIEVKIIRAKEEVSQLLPLYISHLLWGTKEAPRTYAYLGFIPGDGFYLRMVCEEKNPLRRFTEDNEPVYQDSAVEAFFLFESNRGNTTRPIYANFEMNANGVLLASYGQERKYRSYFMPEDRAAFACRAQIEEELWSVDLRIPVTVLERIYGPLGLAEGSYFTCNFYKISESREIEHYAAYAPIKSVIPSFHLPESFAEAHIIK